MFEKVEISFLVKSSEYRVSTVISEVTRFLYGKGLVVSDVKDVDCGRVDLEEAVERWGVDARDYAGSEEGNE